MTKTRRCRPHQWRVPEVGDDALECEACGRRLRFMEDMTPNMHASILASIERREGDAAAGRFRAAYNAACDAARRRFRPPQQSPALPPSSYVTDRPDRHTGPSPFRSRRSGKPQGA